MFLYKYERFIYDFIGFDGCLLDPTTKPKGRAKWSFIRPFTPASNQLTWANQISSIISNTLAWASCSLPRRICAFSIKLQFTQASYSSLGQISLHLLAFSIHRHVFEAEKDLIANKKHKKLRNKKKKVESGA